MKLDILAIGVHPDDVELGCGGTVIKHIDLGYKVGILDLTQGELGTRGNAKLRLQEAEDAKNYAGVLIRENIALADGFFQNDKESKLEIIKVIRKYQPDIVLTNAINDRHPDHANANKLTNEACFLSGLSKIETFNEDGSKQTHWRPRKNLSYIQDFYIEPDVVVDISGYLERKFEMIACFKSQFFDPQSKELDTPISDPNFLENLKGRALEMGRRIGVSHGEGFTSRSFIGVDDITQVL